MAAVVAAATLTLGCLPAGLAAVRADGSRVPAGSPFPSGKVTFSGHGWGPALGMGQWGAFGYAAQYHRTYSWILSHFYSGTTDAYVHNPMVSIAIVENLGDQVVVTSPSGWRFGGVQMPAGHAGRAVLNSSGRWTVSEATSCSAPASSWHNVAASLTNPLAIPASRAPTAPSKDLLTICRADGVRMTVRGIVEAFDHDGGMRTLNLVRLEEYVADVTPSESSAGWGDYGGAGPQGKAWGFQSLEAQAVAARTFTLAYAAGGGWYGYADICDTGCQSYPGIANENALTTAATSDTAGLVLELKGSLAPTQYSASTGGYTVNDSTWAGTTPYAEVPDAGDAVCIRSTGWTCNIEHSWNESVSVAKIQSTWPAIGTLESVKVLTRYGSARSAFGGRVADIEAIGSKGHETVAGYIWANDFGFLSDWFAVTDGPGATAVQPAAVGAPAAHPAAAGRARTAVPSLFAPTGPLPSPEVSRARSRLK